MPKKEKETLLEDAEVSKLLDSLTDEELAALQAELENETDSEAEKEPSDEVSEETADGTGGVPDNASKTNAMSIAMKKMAGMSFDQIDFFLKSLGQVGHEADPAPDAAKKNADSIKMKGTPDSISNIQESLKAALKEDLANVFGDNKELTEEFKEKITVLFESAVGYRVTVVEQSLKEEYEKKFDEEVSALSENLIGKVDDYLSYVADEWIKANEVAIQNSLKAELAEDLLDDLKKVLIAHNVNIPTEKVDVVDELQSKVKELEEAYNAEIEKNMSLVKTLKENDRDKLVGDFTSGMTLSQTEKFKQLVEDVEYDGDKDAFVKKLEIVKSSHFGPKTTKAPTTNIITEEISYTSADEVEKEEEVQVHDPVMRNYVSAISRTIKH
jgi:hypothetical protein